MRRVILQQGKKIIWETDPTRGTMRFVCMAHDGNSQTWETQLPSTVPLEDLRYITAHSILPALDGAGGVERLSALSSTLDLEALNVSKFVTRQMAIHGRDRQYPTIEDYIAQVKVISEEDPLAA